MDFGCCWGHFFFLVAQPSQVYILVAYQNFTCNTAKLQPCSQFFYFSWHIPYFISIELGSIHHLHKQIEKGNKFCIWMKQFIRYPSIALLFNSVMVSLFKTFGKCFTARFLSVESLVLKTRCCQLEALSKERITWEAAGCPRAASDIRRDSSLERKSTVLW